MLIGEDRYLRVLVDPDEDIADCPFRSDLNTCTVTMDSPINFCPDTKEDDDWTYEYVPPEGCPLANYEGVIVTFNKSSRAFSA